MIECFLNLVTNCLIFLGIVEQRHMIDRKSICPHGHTCGHIIDLPDCCNCTGIEYIDTVVTVLVWRETHRCVNSHIFSSSKLKLYEEEK